MEELVNKIQPIAKNSESLLSRSRFLMASTLMHLRKKRYQVSDEMLANTIEAFHINLELGNIKSRVDCQFELGFLYLWRRELDEAEENLQAVLKMTEAYQIFPIRTLSLTYLTILYRFRDQLDLVGLYAKHAEEAAHAAHTPDYIAAAKANDAWLAWRRRDMQSVEQSGQEALSTWRQSPLVYPFQWLALWPLLAINVEQACEQNAWGYVDALLEPLQQRLPGVINAALEKALEAKARNQAEMSSSYLKKALKFGQDLGYI
jgi:hypothetical protein